MPPKKEAPHTYSLDSAPAHPAHQHVKALDNLQQDMLDALEYELSPRAPSLKFHPWGSDNAVLADAVDLVNRSAEVLGRKARMQPPRS